MGIYRLFDISKPISELFGFRDQLMHLLFAQLAILACLLDLLDHFFEVFLEYGKIRSYLVLSTHSLFSP